MTSFERFENRIPMLLEDLAVPSLPDYAEGLFARTAATRQRAGWTFPERWPIVSAITRRFAVAPRLPLRLVAVVALIALAAVLAVVAAGALFKHVAPFGPAGNGYIAMTNSKGEIVVGNPTRDAQSLHVIVTGSGNRMPTWSRDGTRLVYQHAVDGTGGRVDLIVVNADGSDPVKLTPQPIPEPGNLDWSPKSDRIIVNGSAGELLIYGAGRTAEPTVLGYKELGGTAELGIGPLAAARPPDGNEILFVRGSDAPPSLMAIRPDGTGLRTLIDAKSSGLSFRNVQGAQWSPDGSQVVVLLDMKYTVEARLPYVLNADGTNLRPLGQVGLDQLADLNSPRWSPDGTKIAFQYWRFHSYVESDGEDFFPIQVVDVATGAMHGVGPTYTNGYVSWEWSPDGKSILEVPGAENGGNDCSGALCKPLAGGSILISNVETGEWVVAPWRTEDAINWQRTAE